MARAMQVARRRLSWTAGTVVLCAVAAGCGSSTPRQPPPAAGSPPRGSVVVHAVGGADAAPFYQEVGNRLLGSGTTLNYQLVGGVRVTSALSRASVSLVAAQTARPLGDLPRVRDSGELLVPVAFSGVAVIYNLPGVRHLRLRGGVIAAIYEERIKRWNDRRIAHDNPGVTLPSTTITVVHRSDASVTTDLFTAYLTASSRRWKRQTGTGLGVNWSAGTAVPDDATMRQVVSATPGTIGYTDAATSLRNKLPAARLRTASGDYVAPSLRALSAVGEQPLEPNDLSLPTIGAATPGAYPISSEQYVLTLRDLCTAGRTDAEQSAVKHLVLYFLGEGQSVARQLSFAPLPPHLRAVARREVRAMRCGDGTV
jgi:phosphate transport system substrate-binding protein